MIAKIVVTASLAALAVGSAHAQRYAPMKPPPAGRADLGWELEQRFTSYMGTCGVTGQLKMIKPSIVYNTERPVSSIDSDLINAMKLDTGYAVEPPLGVGLGRFFGYVYSDAEKANPQWLSSNFLSVRYDEDKGFINAFGFPSKRYSASCGSVLGTALKSGSEYSFPIATLKAAFEADYKAATTSTIEVSNGRFESPIWDMWKPAAGGDAQRSKRKFFAAMLLWDWYDKAAPSGRYWLLTTFDGTSFHRQLSANVKANASGSLEGGTSIPFVTASGKINAGVTSDRKLEVQDFEVFVNAPTKTGPAVRQWREMPSLDDVLDAIRQSANVAPPALANPSPITSNQTRSFTVDIDGLPTAYCEAPSWNIRDSASATAPSEMLAIDSAARVADSTLCRFALSYTAGTIATGGDLVLTPALTSTASVGTKHVVVPLKRLSLATTTNPSMTLLLGDPRAKVSKITGSTPTQYDLVWTIDLKLIDDGKFADVTHIRTNQLGLVCPANTLTLGDAQVDPTIIGTDSGSRTLRLTARARFLGGDIDGSYAFDSCTLGGSVVFRPSDSGASMLERAVPANITLYYPKRVATP